MHPAATHSFSVVQLHMLHVGLHQRPVRSGHQLAEFTGRPSH